jgi:hypothetical protein
MKEKLLKKVKQLKEEQNDIEQSKEALKTEIQSLEREIDSYKLKAEIDRKNFEDLMRERDILNKNLVNASASQSKQSMYLFMLYLLYIVILQLILSK